jgi:hypothetical protein
VIKMKKLLYCLAIGLLSPLANAAVVSRTYTYTSGNTITANENNTNENTLYNEFNGNIESANIKDGTIVNADIADTTIAVGKFSSAVQSTFTWVYTFGAYRRPVLTFQSVTTVDVQNNTGTANETCIEFPGEQRCVTENTSTTNKYRRFDITAACQFTSGTEDSGLTGATEATNTWYALYAVKSLISSSNFVICGSTNTPTQADFARLNTMFNTGGWVYLGMIRNGDNNTATGDILTFSQSGNITTFKNTASGNILAVPGVFILGSDAATNLDYTYSAGTGTVNVPMTATHVYWTFGINGASGGAGANDVVDHAGTHYYHRTSGTITFLGTVWMPASDGIKTANTNAVKQQIHLSGFIDNALGVGFNPQL